MAMFVTGILYLTVDFYQYTFSEFNTTVVAAILVSFGVVIANLALVNILLLLILLCRENSKYPDDDYKNRNSNSKSSFYMGILITFCSGLILILFIILLAIGIWGLVLYSNGSLNSEVRNNFINAIRNYVIGGINDQTQKIDWLQSKFECCGAGKYFSL
jgi:hypothetical protein